jgi:hypothetical protein
MPSALPKMSIGTLACHLGRQVVRAAELLPVATDVPPLESVDAHYHRAAWVTSSSPDDPSNDRSTDDAEAALGAAVLADRSAGALATVRRLLAAGTACDVVLIPWQGWSLRRDEFLLTRMLEIVVHADDLALSAGVRTPEFPAEVFAPVRDLLVRLAVNTATALISYDGLTCGNASPRERAVASLRPADVQDLEPVQHKCRCRVKRHGQSAVIGALTRSERTQAISAF